MGADLTEFEAGFLTGVLACEGHFGGDGKQPQVTLRLHTRRSTLAHWLVAKFPRTKLYGPYTHGGRSYYQWTARGDALVQDLLPILELRLDPRLDQYAYDRLHAMRNDYAAFIERLRRRADLLASDDAAGEPPVP